MPTRSERNARTTPRGYALMAVIVITVLILSGASILLLVGRDASLTGTQEKRGTEAHGVALAGLQWMLANLNSQLGKDAAVECATSGNPLNESGKMIYRFDKDATFVGVPGPPPAAGVSNSNWTAFGDGHYGLTVAVDPLDMRRSVLVRSIGVVTGRVVVLETNLRLNLVQTVPSGITGCFDTDFQITFYDQEGPYDYTGNFRLDGGGGVPMAISADHNRINGLARDDGGSPTIFSALSGYTQGRKWRGTQSLRNGPVPSGVTNRFGGTQTESQVRLDDDIGPLALWERNRYIANDPRIVDTFSVTNGPRGLGLGDGGLVYDSNTVNVGADTTRQRGLPLVAYISAPNAAQVANVNGGFLGQDAWGGRKDDEARKGFYACDNHGGGNASINDTIEVCAKGSAGASAPDWGNSAVNHSGRAHGLIQSALRQCTGSGSSIDPLTGSPFRSVANPNGVACSRGFEWLENLAACLILPRSVATQSGTNALRPAEDAGGKNNNFIGCHPGCLIATDVDNDNAITNNDRPFRSSCINLDAESVAAYGPGLLPDKAGGVFSGTYNTTTGAGDPYANQWKAWNTVNPTVTAATDAGNSASAARFAFADGTTVKLGGAIRERGNDSLITRLDMSDRGPLGTCEQNCLAYGFGKDVTYGAHRTDLFPSNAGAVGTAADPHCVARVPNHGSGDVVEHCNLDRDGDGFLDRKSYALNSAYREECVDPHDGVAWAPAFNISNANTSLGGTGCRNNMPERNDGQRLVPFCDNGNDEELRASIDALELIATTVTSSNMNKNTPDLPDGDGWWGGAKCHMGTGTTFGGASHTHTGNLAALPLSDTDRLGHPDFWIEDVCPNPVVVRVDSSANINIGKVCGCGVLLLPGQSMQLGQTSSLLWRGLVIWDLKGASGKELKIDGTGAASFVVDGAMLIAGDDGIEIKVTKGVGNGGIVSNNVNGETVKQLFRMNPKALEDAFSGIKAPVRTIRRVQ